GALPSELFPERVRRQVHRRGHGGRERRQLRRSVLLEFVVREAPRALRDIQHSRKLGARNANVVYARRTRAWHLDELPRDRSGSARRHLGPGNNAPAQPRHRHLQHQMVNAMRSSIFARSALAIPALLWVVACQDLTSLQQSNPGQLSATDAYVPSNAQVLVTGATEDFWCAYQRYVVGSALFTDELSVA